MEISNHEFEAMQRLIGNMSTRLDNAYAWIDTFKAHGLETATLLQEVMAIVRVLSEDRETALDRPDRTELRKAHVHNTATNTNTKRYTKLVKLNGKAMRQIIIIKN